MPLQRKLKLECDVSIQDLREKEKKNQAEIRRFSGYLTREMVMRQKDTIKHSSNIVKLCMPKKESTKMKEKHKKVVKQLSTTKTKMEGSKKKANNMKLRWKNGGFWSHKRNCASEIHEDTVDLKAM